MDPPLLLQQVEACYKHPFGPGGIPGMAGARESPHVGAGSPQGLQQETIPTAFIVPHGALGHSGPIAAHAYALLSPWTVPSHGVLPSLIVLLGPDHLGLGSPVSATTMNYATPLGVVFTEVPLVLRICEQAKAEAPLSLIRDAPAGHTSEHSVENQLPFIQHLAWHLAGRPELPLPPPEGFPGLPRLIPLTMAAQDLSTAQALAALLDTVLPSNGAILIVTSDMSHCGRYYANLPMPERHGDLPVSQWCSAQTRQAIDAISTMEPARLINAFHSVGLSMCGVGAVATAIAFARRRGAETAHVLAVSQSVDVAAAWRGHLPTDESGYVLSPWELLTDVDAQNPVGFACIALA